MDNSGLSNEDLGAAPGQDRQKPYLRIHHITVFVRDQDRSVRFYVDLLGFNLALDYVLGEHSRFVMVAPPDGTALLALVAPKPETEEYKLIGNSGQVVFVTEDVTAQFNIWHERGVRFSDLPQTAKWGGVSVSFEDPDENSFVLVGWDELSKDIESNRRTAAEKLESERRAAQELEIAKQVQGRLFPQTAPRLRSLDYSGNCIQAREVGGDYYDFIDLGRDRLALVIADISGKGMAAALLMANLQANMRSQFAIAIDEPERFLQSVNRLFFQNTTNSVYATLFFAEYNDKTQHLRYANCGHLAGLLLRPDHSVERLESTGTVLGLFNQWDCSIEERALFYGDTLLLYTDGITESFNDVGEEFGEQRLLDALVRYHDLASEALLAALLQEVRQFSSREQHDDFTMIVAKCTGPAVSHLLG